MASELRLHSRLATVMLPGDQDELVRRVAEVNDRTIVVVNAGMPVLMPWADQVAAIGCCWLPGQTMGDVLLGRAEPGGRLPVTIPVAEADCPVRHSVPDQDRLDYAEGPLIGYRGYDRAGTAPRFAFGHGLGYTTWAYESAAAEPAAAGPLADLELTVMIRNAGPRRGREVVQAYVEPVGAEAGRPVRTLAAFAAATAEPGQAAEVRLTVPARAFARYDEAAGCWFRSAGEFIVRVGRSSATCACRSWSDPYYPERTGVTPAGTGLARPVALRRALSIGLDDRAVTRGPVVLPVLGEQRQAQRFRQCHVKRVIRVEIVPQLQHQALVCGHRVTIRATISAIVGRDTSSWISSRG